MLRNNETRARQLAIDSLSLELDALLPLVLNETGLDSKESLHAKYGGKFAQYIDIKSEVIHSSDHFISLYLEGFKRKAEASHPGSAHVQNLRMLRESDSLKVYLAKFLKRTYLRNFDALSKRRPPDEEAILWIGQKNANYAIAVTPRFHPVTQEWTNDHSEIRHFDQPYWSIGHVLKTGLLIPGKDRRREFSSVVDYLDFFVDVLVRQSGSKYESAIAEMYRDFVLQEPEALKVPLLIPEFRYTGRLEPHQYRLDFTIIDPHALTKVGFELSPWSTHGYLSQTKGMTQKEINEAAKENFEKEMAKHKAFFRKHGIYSLIYTDSDLADLTGVFKDMIKYLRPGKKSTQLSLDIMNEMLGI